MNYQIDIAYFDQNILAAIVHVLPFFAIIDMLKYLYRFGVDLIFWLYEKINFNH